MGIYRKESQGEPFLDASYAVYSIRKVDYQEPFWEIDQKIAKLLSELDGKGNSSRAPIDFLRDTMEGYKHLEKYKDIMSFKLKESEGHQKNNNYLINFLRIQPSNLIFLQVDNSANECLHP